MYSFGDGFLASLLATALEGVVVYDAAGRIVYINNSALQMLRYSRSEVVGKSGEEIELTMLREDGSPCPPDDHPGLVTLRTGEPCRGVVLGLQRGEDPHVVWVSVNTARVDDPAHPGSSVFAVFTDITAVIESMRRLSETEAQLLTVLQAIPDLVWAKDLRGRYLACNPEFEKFFGAPASEIIGKSDADFVDASQAKFFRDRDAEAIRADGPQKNEEFVTYASDGRRVLLETIKTPMRDAAGRIVGVLGIGRNITAHRAAEERLENAVVSLETLTVQLQALARTDALTGLANRRALDDAIEAELRRCRRFGTPAAVLMIDVDHFKAINDTRGHEVGDHALIALAHVLAAAARETDVVARFGGEEFEPVLPATPNAGGMEMAERLRRSVEKMTVPSDGDSFGFTISIGVSVLSAADEDASVPIARADEAMYRAKMLGRNRVFGEPASATA